MTKKANLKYTFLLFSYFFIVRICSSVSGVDTGNHNTTPSFPNENVTESHEQSSTASTKVKEEKVSKNIPPDKEIPDSKSSSDKELKKESNEPTSVDAETKLKDSSKPEKESSKEELPKETKSSEEPANLPTVQEPISNMKPVMDTVKDTRDTADAKPVTPSTSEIPKTTDEKVTEKKTDNQSITAPVTDKGDASTTTTDQPEDGADVPTFGEYQRKFTGKRDGAVNEGKNGNKIEVKGGTTVTKPVEKNGGEATTPQPVKGTGNGGVVRFKNVGSTSCGAKVVANNDDASNPAHVLNENRDEYMNHPCNTNKWFVVEACEPVRLRQVDIASYELFSSMVKTFRISASERFPQKLWDMVGTFTAKNEKGVQTYRVEQDKYYKYFKFELLEHHGNEHFCPLSLIRLFGVLVEDDDGDDEQSSEHATEEGNASGSQGRDENSGDENSRSLFQSATKVIADIVTKFQTKKSEDNSQANVEPSPTTSPLPSTDSSPGVKTETRLSQLKKLLQSGESLLRRCLELLTRSPKTLTDQLVDNEYIPTPSMAFLECSKAAVSARLSAKDLRWAYLLFNNASLPVEPEKRAAQFGDIPKVPVAERDAEVPKTEDVKTVDPPRVNIKVDIGSLVKDPPVSVTPKPKEKKSEEPIVIEKVEKTEEVKKRSSTPVQQNESSLKTTDNPDDSKMQPKIPKVPLETPKAEETVTPAVPKEKPKADEPVKKEVEAKVEKPKSEADPSAEGEKKPVEKAKVEETPVKGEEPPKQQQKDGTNGRIKENAYMRLSNKLRAMEINVTMSMAYLEELSRNYKKKTDKISKNMDVALQKLQETASKGEERDRLQQQRITTLENQIEELRSQLKRTMQDVKRENTMLSHGILLQAVTLNVILIVVHLLFVLYCGRRQRQSYRTSLTKEMTSSSHSHLSKALHNGPMNGGVKPSNSDTNLYIVDPPFRLEEQIVKKDGKKKKKRKKHLVSNHQSGLEYNGFRDRSASESRIEELL